MSSREIAELTGKRHDNVLADIRKMLGELGNHSTEFSAQYQDSTGRSLPMLNLTMAIALRYIVKANTTLGLVVMEKAVTNGAVLKAVLEALQDFETPDDLPEMFVYAIRNTVTGNIKLGISRNPDVRLKQLQTGNDCRLELVAYRPAHNRFSDERALHIENNSNRISGEWFSGDSLKSFQ
jgi:hypothetical protein